MRHRSTIVQSFLAIVPRPGYNYDMTIDIDATYRDGALHPVTPLNLPENTPVHVRVETSPAGNDVVLPPSPRFTAEEFRAAIERYAVSVGTLPPDFSREDIYGDHD